MSQTVPSDSLRSVHSRCPKRVITTFQTCDFAADLNVPRAKQQGYLQDVPSDGPRIPPARPSLSHLECPNQCPWWLVCFWYFSSRTRTVHTKHIDRFFQNVTTMSQQGTCLVHRDHPPTQDLTFGFVFCGWPRGYHCWGWGLSRSGLRFFGLLCRVRRYRTCPCFRAASGHQYHVRRHHLGRRRQPPTQWLSTSLGGNSICAIIGIYLLLHDADRLEKTSRVSSPLR